MVANRVMAVPSGALVHPLVVTQAMVAPMAVEEVVWDAALLKTLEGLSVAFAKARALGPLAVVLAMAAASA